MKAKFLVLVMVLALASTAMAAQTAPAEAENPMAVVALVAVVVATTQAIKKGLEALFGKPLVPAVAFILSAIMAFFTVAIKALQVGHPFNVALLFIFVQVVAYSSGGFLLIKKLVLGLNNK